MAIHYRRIADYLRSALAGRGLDDLARLRPRHDPSPPRVPGGSTLTDDAMAARWALPGLPASAREVLADARTMEEREAYARNIENFIGTVKVPVGLAGPLRVNGAHAHGDYYVPLATTEAALVASYSRGAQLITDAGGCAAVVLNEGVTRAPAFAFETLGDATAFVAWAASSFEAFKAVAGATTRHGELVDLQLTVEGNHVYLRFEFTTGDASGQNMVTIATEAICRYIVEHSPVQPRYWFVEANMSGDKKATTHSFMSVRGKKVSAEVDVPAALDRGAPAHDARTRWSTTAHVGARRRDERQHRRAGALRQRPRRALHRLRPGRGVRRRGGRRRHAVRGARGRRPVRGGDAAESDRRHRRRRHAVCRVSRPVSTSWGWPVPAMRARSRKWRPRSCWPASCRSSAPSRPGTSRARTSSWPAARRRRVPHEPLDRLSARALSARRPRAAGRRVQRLGGLLLLARCAAASTSRRRRLCWSPSSRALLFFLQLRIADEFKDFEDDARYRPYRPVPRGLVTLRELAWVGVGAAAIQLALALWLEPSLGLAARASPGCTSR